MNSRERILSALRPHCSALPHPGGLDEPMVFQQPAAQFAELLGAVGGHCVTALDGAEAAAAVRACLPWTDIHRVLSLDRRLVSLCDDQQRVALDDLASPHACADIDLLVAPGVFGVAENGAVWVDGTQFGARRAALFLCQHLVLTVPAEQIVATMHQAYPLLSLHGYGCFISGPSKTADIEQSLVVGAHGPLSCTVCLLGS